MDALERIAADAQAEILAAAVSALRAAGVRAGALVRSADEIYDSAADVLEELARPFGPEANYAALAGLDAGMAGEVTEWPMERPESQPAYSAPALGFPPARGPFRDAEACAAAVVAWAGTRLVPDPVGRVSAAELAASWARFDGRALVGYGSLTEAVSEWARCSGIEVGRYRTERARGLSGVRLADTALTSPDAERLTPPDTLPDRDEDTAGRSISESAEAGPADWADRAVTFRPPAGGWQSWSEVQSAASADAGGWTVA